PDGQNPEALATGAGRRLAGSRHIYDLDSDDVFDSGTGGDSKIRAMVIDEAAQVLWAGTDGNGVAAFDLMTNTSHHVHTSPGSGLGSNKVRALAVETQGPYAGDV